MTPFTIDERIRWRDCDPLGIIHYSAYLRICEVAEFEMFRACGLPFDILRTEGGVWLPRKACQMEFHSPAQMDEAVIVEARFAAGGTTSLTMKFEIYRASDRLHRASVSITTVCVKKETMEKYPLPEHVRHAIARYREEG